ncbi:hypothetical protein CANARDRAFT_180506, partial [[Candida] arabinofermentans NRRL YB-2248]
MARKRSAIDFQFGECIGEGSYSKVLKGISIHNHKTYAIKILSKSHIQRENKRKYVNIEKDTLNLLGKHPGIVTLYYTFQDEKSLYFVIDFAKNGELLSLIRKLGSLSESLAKYYMVQLIDAVGFIHSKGIIHRDLKPENILLNSEWKLMVTDFGAAKILSEEDQLLLQNSEESGENSSGSTRTGSFVGTAEYVSPELLKYNMCGFECDLWAIGCILYQLIVGRPPFKGQTEYMTFEKIISLDYEFPANYFVPPQIKHIVENLLVLKPEKRFTIETLKQQEWFRDINWNNKDMVWKRKVPKLEAYNPRLYTLLQGRQQVLPSSSSQSSQPSTASQYYVQPGEKMTSKMSSMPQTVLKNQIINAQNNPQLMNKVLTNRLAEKNKEIKDQLIKTQTSMNAATIAASKSSSKSRIPSSPTIQQPSPVYLTNKDDLLKRRNSLQFVNGDEVSMTPPMSRESSPSISSMKTNGTSSKSVIITPVLDSPLRTAPSSTTSQPPRWGESLSSSSSASSNPSSAASSPQFYSAPSMIKASNASRAPSISEMFGLPQPSSQAVSAAGAVGNLMSHKRTMKSTTNLTNSQYQIQQQQQVINPILLDKQIPKVITSKLMNNEYILKLDNIFKSELTHKANQFVQQGQTLDDTILNKVITENYQTLNRDLKSCILIITSMARLLIYEINSDFRLQNPQSSTQLQALDFYSKIIEIKLTNRNVSMYDYEFDEELKEGYLILELMNVNKLIFLSAYSAKTLVKGSINSNIRIGFKVNESTSWIDSLLKAKELLKQNKD